MDNLPQLPSGVFLLRRPVEIYSGVDTGASKTARNDKRQPRRPVAAALNEDYAATGLLSTKGS